MSEHEAFNPVVLYGPPSVGKSTLIALAKERGYEAYDFEKMGSSYEERKAAMLETFLKLKSGFVLCGAADLRKSDFPIATRSVLLLPEREEYLRHLAKRDSEHPHKMGQNALEKYDHSLDRQSEYEFVFSDISSPEHLLDEILSKFVLN
jgi:guanylate kinase